LIGGAIDVHVIAENWDEILRLAASIKAGTVAPSGQRQQGSRSLGKRREFHALCHQRN
jgi:hypothetical protein